MIIVFRENLTIGAIIDSTHGITEVRDESLRERLDEFSRAMASDSARLRVGAQEGEINRVGYRLVGRDSPDYEEALVFELRIRGLAAMPVDAATMPLFDLLSTERFTPEQRNQVISILRNLPHDRVAEFVQDIFDVAALGGQLGEVRAEWDAFTKKGVY